jgi:hypothetical protein
MRSGTCSLSLRSSSSVTRADQPADSSSPMCIGTRRHWASRIEICGYRGAKRRRLFRGLARISRCRPAIPVLLKCDPLPVELACRLRRRPPDPGRKSKCSGRAADRGVTLDSASDGRALPSLAGFSVEEMRGLAFMSCVCTVYFRIRSLDPLRQFNISANE